MFHRLDTECDAEYQIEVCVLVAHRTYPNETEMLLLAVSLAERESELDTIDDRYQDRTLIHSLIWMDSHIEVIRLMVACGASAAKGDKDDQNAFS